MALRTHCRNGHEWTDASTYVAPNGQLMCRDCRRDARRRCSAKKRSPKVRIAAAPLVEVLEQRLSQRPGFGVTHGNVPRPIPLDGTQMRILRKAKTIDLYRADRIACDLGMHPTQIWPDFDRIEAA